MYVFEAFKIKNSWIETTEEIHLIASVIDHVIDIIEEVVRYYPCYVASVFVEGGVHEQDIGYEAFASRNYPYYDYTCRKSWSELMVEDFSREKEELVKSTDGWYRHLNLSQFVITLLAHGKPVVIMAGHHEQLYVQLSWEPNERTARILSALEAEYGPAKEC